MVGADMAAAAEPLGVRAPFLYFRGRIAPVLGVEHAEQAAAVYRIFPAGLLAKAWADTADLSAADAVRGYLTAADHAARRLLPDAAARELVADLAPLARRVVEAAALPDADAFAITSAWRAQPWPEPETALSSYWAVVLLRELRGSRHFAALDEVGLPTPFAGLVGLGVPGLRNLGWREEQLAQLTEEAPDLETLGALRAEAVRRTNAAFAADLAVLSPSERSRLAVLVGTVADLAAH